METPRPSAGLCDRCRHQRLVPNTRGSVFSLCERSRSDPRFPRYPRLPVGSCAGFEPAPGPADGSPAAGVGEDGVQPPGAAEDG